MEKKLITKKTKVNKLVLALAVLFIISCFINGHILFAYPLIVLFLTLIKFEWGLQFLFFTLGVNYALFQNEYFFNTFHPNSFITIGQLLFAFLGLTKIKKLKLDSKTIILFTFMIISLVSILYSPDKINGLKVFANILLYPLLLLLFFNDKKTSLNMVYKYIVINALILWFVVYPLQYIVMKTPMFMFDFIRGYRFNGGGVHPVPLAFFMVLVFYSALSLFTSEKSIKYLIVMIISLIFTFLTYSRSAIVGMLLTFFLYLYQQRKLHYALPIIIIAIILLITPMVNYLFLKNSPSYNKNLNYITSGRIGFWEASLKKISESPLFGSGIGSSLEVMELFSLNTPHEEFLRVLIETGFFGFIFFLIFLYLETSYLFRSRKINLIPLCLFLFFIITLALDNSIDYNLYLTFQIFIIIGIANRNQLASNLAES